VAPLLDVRNLQVRFQTATSVVRALAGVTFSVSRERVAIVGESGSGKSTIGRSIMRLLPDNATIAADCMRLDAHDLLHATERTMSTLRGRRISMILQDPKYSLNPTMTVGQQIMESYRTHYPCSRSRAREQALTMLESVRIREASRVFHLYPHQISLGMGQRVMIAMMLAPQPEILIADEPTSALDVSIRAQLLELLDELIVSRGMALLLISHDLDLVASFCDRVIIMYAGHIVETCSAKQLLAAKHPYTRGLLECRPQLRSPREVLPTLSRDPAWVIEEHLQ
jgi:peptide/nickel transport system ATP-binding protein